MLSLSLPHPWISTSSLSEPVAQARLPRCSSRDEACVCSRSIAAATGAIRSRPTPSCAPALSNSPAGAFSKESKRPARLWSDRRRFTTATRSSRCRSNRSKTLKVSTHLGVLSLTGCLSMPRNKPVQRSHSKRNSSIWSAPTTVASPVCASKIGQDRERQVSAELVIGADGVHSTVARLVGSECYRTGHHATGVVFSYWSGPGFDGYHWYYNPGVSAGAIPTNDGLTCIFASVPQGRFHETMSHGTDAGYRQVLRECASDLAAVVEQSERVEKYRGFSGETGFFRQSFGPGWALVGDAGYFKDPLTAHGITDAFIDAELLAQAAAAGTEAAFAGYQSARDKLAVGHFEVTDAVASFEWDLPKAQQLHRALSDEMKKESLAVASFATPA